MKSIENQNRKFVFSVKGKHVKKIKDEIRRKKRLQKSDAICAVKSLKLFIEEKNRGEYL